MQFRSYIFLHSVVNTCYPLYATNCFAVRRRLSNSCSSLVVYSAYHISRTFYGVSGSAGYPKIFCPFLVREGSCSLEVTGLRVATLLVPLLSVKTLSRLPQRIIHSDLQFHPHKLHVLQELSGRNFSSSSAFCEHSVTPVNEHRDFILT
jgi:hypothetical protein